MEKPIAKPGAPETIEEEIERVRADLVKLGVRGPHIRQECGQVVYEWDPPLSEEERKKVLWYSARRREEERSPSRSRPPSEPRHGYIASTREYVGKIPPTDPREVEKMVDQVATAIRQGLRKFVGVPNTPQVMGEILTAARKGCDDCLGAPDQRVIVTGDHVRVREAHRQRGVVTHVDEEGVCASVLLREYEGGRPTPYLTEELEPAKAPCQFTGGPYGCCVWCAPDFISPKDLERIYTGCTVHAEGSKASVADLHDALVALQSTDDLGEVANKWVHTTMLELQDRLDEKRRT